MILFRTANFKDKKTTSKIKYQAEIPKINNKNKKNEVKRSASKTKQGLPSLLEVMTDCPTNPQPTNVGKERVIRNLYVNFN